MARLTVTPRGINTRPRIQPAYSTPLNVKWFGAKVDGATDDTAAFTAAANTNAATIYVPPGTAILNDFEWTREGVKLTGAGRSATILKAKAGAAQVLGIQGLRYNTIQDLTIDGNAGASKGLLLSSGAATSQDQRLENVCVQNCSIGIHVANVGSTQADKNLFIDTQLIGNTIGFQSDSVNSQETIFVGLDVSFTANNQIGVKLNAAGGGACLGVLGGQMQGNGVATGLTSIQITGVNRGWIWLKDYIDELIAISIDGSVTWPLGGVDLDQAVLQGSTACVMMGPIIASAGGGVLYGRLCRFNAGASSGAGVIESFVTGTAPRAILEDCNLTLTAPAFTVNAGAVPVLQPGELPRAVGTAGQPAFANTWASVGGNTPFRFYLDRAGLVHIEGGIQAGAGGEAAASQVCVMPTGYRPVAPQIAGMIGAAGPNRLQVNAAGAVSVIGSTAANGSWFPNITYSVA